MNIVITGATSMIGVSLLKKCMKEGAKVYAVVRKDSGRLSRLENIDGIKLIYCDIEEYGSLPEKIGTGCDIFYHLAWKGTGSSAQRNADLKGQAENIGYTLDALKAAHELGAKTFVGAGSQAEYGLKNVDAISPDESANPIQPYGIAKYAAGKMAGHLAKRYGMNCFWVRIFSVYGELDDSHTMICYTIEKLKKREMPKYTPAGQRWDYLYCEDAAKALYLIGKQDKGNKVYCLGSGIRRPLAEYIRIIRDKIDPKLPVGLGAYDYPENAVMNLCADISEIRRDTGWEPDTAFESGIQRILDFQNMESGGANINPKALIRNGLQCYVLSRFFTKHRKLCCHA